MANTAPIQRKPVLDTISHNPALKPKTIITTYYQETLTDREIDLKEYMESAKRGERSFVVFNLTCSIEENVRRLQSRAAGTNVLSSRLADVRVLEDVRRNHVVFSFGEHGYHIPDVYEYGLDVEHVEPAQAARKLLEYLGDIPGAQI